MPKFVVYEIWSRSRTVEAASEGEALEVSEPTDNTGKILTLLGMNLGNWHVQPVEDAPAVEVAKAPRKRKARVAKPAVTEFTGN